MTMPTASVSASIVIELSVKPWYQIRPKVAMIEVGMAIAAMIVERQFQRNTSTTPAARIEPTIRCSSTLSDGGLDELGQVADDPDVVAGRHQRLQIREPLLHRVDDLRRCWCPTAAAPSASTVGSPLRLAFVVGLGHRRLRLVATSRS